MRCEVASRTPTCGCSRLLSNGAFLTTSPTLHHTHTSWKLPREQQTLPTSSSCLAVTRWYRWDLLLPLKMEVTVPDSSPSLSPGAPGSPCLPALLSPKAHKLECPPHPSLPVSRPPPSPELLSSESMPQPPPPPPPCSGPPAPHQDGCRVCGLGLCCCSLS